MSLSRISEVHGHEAASRVLDETHRQAADLGIDPPEQRKHMSHVVVGDHTPEPRAFGHFADDIVGRPAPRQQYAHSHETTKAASLDFVLTRPVRFRLGETVIARHQFLDGSGDIMGLDVVHVDKTRTPLPGYMATYRPLDELMRMPLAVDGVQLWYGWDVYKEELR